MHLPNAESAVVEIEKLRDYCLSTSHPRGRHKARVFAIAFGITANEAEILREALLVAARTAEAKLAEMDEYGQRYVLDFAMEYLDKHAIIRSSWSIRRGEDSPHLTSCYIL
jgi:hypothetical protein